MPFFKSTYNILKKQDEDEVYEPKWFESDKLILPPGGPDDLKRKWDYKRDLKIEDVNIWEVLYEENAGIGVYASWDPYAEFYMITTGLNFRNEPRIFNNIAYWDRHIETYYGQGAQEDVQRRIRELGIPLFAHPNWVEEDEVWLYEKREPKLIIL
jgi:hypothetical protein